MIPYFHALLIQRHGMISALMINGLRKYPFDVQVCELDLLSWTYTFSRLRLIPPKELSLFSYKESVEWAIAHCNITFLQIPSEPVHEISNNVTCATSKASDQPAHTRSLIRAITGRLSIL